MRAFPQMGIYRAGLDRAEDLLVDGVMEAYSQVSEHFYNETLDAFFNAPAPDLEPCFLQPGPWEGIHLPAEGFLEVEYRGTIVNRAAPGAHGYCAEPPDFPIQIDHYEPRDIGPGLFAVHADPELFPPSSNRDASRWTGTANVEPIRLEAIEPRRTVFPGEEITLIARVDEANDPRAEWEALTPGVEFLNIEVDDNIHTARVRLPVDDDHFPVLISIESTSVMGLRNPVCDPPPRRAHFILRSEEDVEVFPQSVCVAEGDTMEFWASVFSESADAPLQWSASGGQIDSQGRFRSDEAGEFVVTASLESGVSDSATIRVGPCECFYRVTLSGGVNATYSDFANATGELLAGELLTLRFGAPGDADAEFVVHEPAIVEGQPFGAIAGGTVKVPSANFGFLDNVTVAYWAVEDEGDAFLRVHRWTENDYLQGRITGVTTTAMVEATIDGAPTLLPLEIFPTFVEVEFLAPLFNPTRNPLGMFTHNCPVTRGDLMGELE